MLGHEQIGTLEVRAIDTGWFLFRCFTQKEFSVVKFLMDAGIEAIVVSEIRKSSSSRYVRGTASRKPLRQAVLPGYVFVLCDDETDGLYGVLSLGRRKPNFGLKVLMAFGKAARVCESDIQRLREIQQMLDDRLDDQSPCEEIYAPGDMVRVTRGSLEGSVVKVAGFNQDGYVLLDFCSGVFDNVKIRTRNLERVSVLEQR